MRLAEWHPYIVGQPYRLRYLCKALAKIARQREEIWPTHPGAIAGHIKRLEPGIVPQPLSRKES